MQNFNYERMRLGNRLAAGKKPVGDFPKQQKGFASFDGIVKKSENYDPNSKHYYGKHQRPSRS